MPRIGAEAAWSIRSVGLGDQPGDPTSYHLKHAFDRREVNIFARLTISYDQIGRPIKNRSYQILDISAWVLMIGVRIHDNIRAQRQRGIDASHESLCQPAVVAMTNDIVGAALKRDLDCVVVGAIINNQNTDIRYSRKRFRNVGNGFVQYLRFVITGDLYE